MMKIKLTLFVTVLVTALFGAGCASVEMPPFVNEGLVAYYSFKGGAKDEVSGEKCRIQGATLVPGRRGQKDSAYLFRNPDDFIDLGKAGISENPEVFTKSVWVKVDKNPNLKHGTIFLLTKRLSDDGEWASLGLISGKAGLFQDVPLSYHGFYNPGITQVEDGRWHHLVGLKEGTIHKIYVDGSLENKKIYGDRKLKGAPHNLFVLPPSRAGKDPAISIDDIRIYNRALSGEEVKSLYDLEKPNAK